MVVTNFKASKNLQKDTHGSNHTRKPQSKPVGSSISERNGNLDASISQRREEGEDDWHEASDSDREQSDESEGDGQEGSGPGASRSGATMDRAETSLNGGKSSGEGEDSGTGWESSESEASQGGEDYQLPFLSSDYTGVFRPAGQRLWKAIIRPDPLTGGKFRAVRHIGSFETEKEAALAYDKVATVLHREPVLNFPPAPASEDETPMEDTDVQESEEEEEDEDSDREDGFPALLEATSHLEGRGGRDLLPRGQRDIGRVVVKEERGRSPSPSGGGGAEAEEGNGVEPVGLGKEAEATAGEQQADRSHIGKGAVTPAVSMTKSAAAETQEDAIKENVEDNTFRGLYPTVRGTWRVITSGSKGVPRNYLGIFGSKTEAAKLHDRAVSYLFRRPVLNFLPDGSINPQRLQGTHEKPCGHKHVPRAVLIDAFAAQQAASAEEAMRDRHTQADSMDEEEWDSSSSDQGEGHEEEGQGDAAEDGQGSAGKPSQQDKCRAGDKGARNAPKADRASCGSSARSRLLDLHTPAVYSHYRGVKTWKNGPRAGQDWVAYIYLKQVYTELGLYKTQEEAARAYDRLGNTRHSTGNTSAGGQRSGVKTRGADKPRAEKPRAEKPKATQAAYTSQFRGVCFVQRQQAWRAEIKDKGQSHFIGYYDHEEDAARAYDRTARRLRANPILNFVDSKLNPHRRAFYNGRPLDGDEEGENAKEDEGPTRMQVEQEVGEGEEEPQPEGHGKGRKRARAEMEEKGQAAHRQRLQEAGGDGKGESKGKGREKPRATQSQGADTASRFRGVRRREEETGPRWEARITAGKHSRYLGCFDTELQAALEYDRVAKQLHSNPVLNFVDGRLNPARKGRAVVRLKHDNSDTQQASPPKARGSQGNGLKADKSVGPSAKDTDTDDDEEEEEDGEEGEEGTEEIGGDGTGEEDGGGEEASKDGPQTEADDDSLNGLADANDKDTWGNEKTEGAGTGNEKDDSEHRDATAGAAEGEKEGEQEQSQQPPPPPPQEMGAWGKQVAHRRPSVLIDLTVDDEEDEDQEREEVQWLGGVRAGSTA